MKVKELIELLKKVNQDAKVIIDNDGDEVSLGYGGAEGVTKETCDTVSINKDFSHENV